MAGPLARQELERKPVESDFLASVPPPASRVAQPWNFEPAKIGGEPLSETVTVVPAFLGKSPFQIA